LFGPLPVLHKIVLVVGALAVWIGLGAWSGAVPHVPVTLGPGIVLGTIAGVVTAYVLLHEFPRRSRASHARGRRRTH
jgi:drug/metabolite transporter (DMT)-like permease